MTKPNESGLREISAEMRERARTGHISEVAFAMLADRLEALAVRPSVDTATLVALVVTWDGRSPVWRAAARELREVIATLSGLTDPEREILAAADAYRTANERAAALVGSGDYRSDYKAQAELRETAEQLRRAAALSDEGGE